MSKESSPLPALPQTGWSTDAAWCAALQLGEVHFRRICTQYQIPRVHLGSNVLLKAEAVYARLEQIMTDGPSEPKASEIPRRRRKGRANNG